jgi:hypothetical protein
MKTFELSRPIGAPWWRFDELVQDTQLVASVVASTIVEAIEKFQNEECITMHIVSVNEETNIADVDIPLRNSNWGWGMGYIEEAK